MRISWNYNSAKEYIKSRNCELLSEEYIGIDKPLKIKFECGHIDFKALHSFRRRANINVCPKCSKRVYDYSEIENFIENSDFSFINKSENFKRTKFIDIYDSDGYKYHIEFYTFITSVMGKGGEPYKFSIDNPYTIENLKLYLSKNKPNLFLEDGQTWNRNNKGIVLFDSDGYKYKVNFTQIRSFANNGGFPDKFNRGNPYTIDNIKNFLKINNKPFYLVDGQIYNGIFSPLKFKCLKCPEDEVPFERHLNGVMRKNSGCSICNSMMIGKYNNLEYLYPEVAKEWDYEKNFPITPNQVAPHSMKKFYWICTKCEHSYFSSLNTRTKPGGRGCPKCATSKGEKIISKYLFDNNIIYSPQFMFYDCRYINPLPFDFAIFNDFDKKDLLLLIEYDGELHFKPYRKMEDSYEKFMNTQRNDKIKNKYCKDNNINLLRISYWDKDNIKEILDKEFLSLRKEE